MLLSCFMFYSKLCLYCVVLCSCICPWAVSGLKDYGLRGLVCKQISSLWYELVLNRWRDLACRNGYSCKLQICNGLVVGGVDAPANHSSNWPQVFIWAYAIPADRHTVYVTCHNTTCFPRHADMLRTSRDKSVLYNWDLSTNSLVSVSTAIC